MRADPSMKSELIRIHHAEYDDDIPFWIRKTEGLERILEIGCGHGRVTLPLIKAGRVLVAVDKDPDSLEYLTGILEEFDNGIRQRISLIESDILGFKPDDLFGGAIIPCNTYSTFNDDDRSRLLRNLYTWLKEDGLLIASLPNPQHTEEILSELGRYDQDEYPDPERMFIHPGTGFPVQVSSRLRASRKSLLWDWIYDHLQPDGQVERFVVTVEHFPRSQDEIQAELEVAGFQDVHYEGDFSGGHYSHSSPYLILICRK